MPVIVLPAHVPVLPAAGVFAGNVLVTLGTTATVPFTGFFVMLTVTASALQLRSHARSCAMRVSTPDSADRVSVSSWAQANATPISEAIRQASETVRVRISAPRCNRHFRAMTSMVADGAVATKATRGLRGAFRCLPPINARLGCGSVWIYVLNSALAASRERLHISRMAHLAQKILRKVIHAAAVVALLTGVASAQSLMPGLNLSGDKPPLTPQEEEKRKAIEDSYKSALKKIPDKQKSVDPWGNIRPNPSTAPKTKQGQQ